MQKPVRTLIAGAVISMISNAVHAGAFSLYTETSPAAIGNYAAGIAAEAADASTGWYNPAGLALIHNKQAVFGGVGVFPTMNISGTSTFTTLSGLPPQLSVYSQNFHDINGRKNAFVPSFHYAIPLGENLTAGFSMLSPFGLMTNWSRQSAVRYEATYTELLTFNFAPELGGKITENFSVGLGIDLQYTRVKFNTVIGVPTVSLAYGLAPDYLDSPLYNKGDSFAPGFHIGGLYTCNQNHTRIGINYQSTVNHKFHGFSHLRGPLATSGLNLTNPLSVYTASPNSVYKATGLYSNPIELPDVTTLSGYQDVNDRLALLGSVVYTGWHTLRSIELNNVAAFSQGVGQIRANTSTNEDYRDAWRFSVGANYKYNEQWMLRVGGGYDETPTVNKARDIRVPDSDRWAISVGGHYQWRPNIGIDGGYTHLFGKTARINNTQFLSTNMYNVNARIDASADLVGLQGVWTMDQPMPMPTK